MFRPDHERARHLHRFQRRLVGHAHGDRTVGRAGAGSRQQWPGQRETRLDVVGIVVVREPNDEEVLVVPENFAAYVQRQIVVQRIRGVAGCTVSTGYTPGSSSCT